MGRLIRVTSIALLLAALTGCHHWHKKHAAAVSYSDCCDPCAVVRPMPTPAMSLAGPPVVSKVLPYGTASPQVP
jgi:hypothetical protein